MRSEFYDPPTDVPDDMTGLPAGVLASLAAVGNEKAEAELARRVAATRAASQGE